MHHFKDIKMLQKRNSMHSPGISNFLTALQICNTMQFTGKCTVVVSLQKCNTMHNAVNTDWADERCKIATPCTSVV